MIEKLSFVNAIVVMGYNSTGSKFSVNFNGSKGYLSHIEITAEGTQTKRNNIIWVERLKTKNGSLMSRMVGIFYSDEDGVRVQVQGEKEDAQENKFKTCAEAALASENGDDLPF
jgi:hypothetical protein